MPTLQAETEVQRPAQQASPALIFEVLHRHQHTMALKGAIDLELFTHIGSGATTTAALAERCRADERGIRILCDFLTVMGLLSKANNSYSLTVDSSVFLDKRSPAYMGSVTGFLSHPVILDQFRDIAGLVRRGGPGNGVGSMSADNDIWVEFANSMVPMISMVAQLVAPIVAKPGSRIKVLDVAAGHGILGISVARANPTAEIIAADWRNVLKVATANAVKAGVQDRFHTLPGDVFESDLGTGFDLVLISNLLHCFDAPANIRLLKKVRSALHAGGQLAVIEFVPNDDKISPPVAASFAMNMLGNTERGDVYTLTEFNSMFREAGFGDGRIQPLLPTPVSLILVSR